MSPPSAAQRVTIVTVCYNSSAIVAGMLASLPEGANIILVDNGSADINALTKLAEAHGARLILNPDNHGFGRACNLGAAQAETEFLLFLNPDAELGDDTLNALVSAADTYPDAVAMNPRIANGDGSAYFKRRSALLPRDARMPRGWPAEDRDVPVLSGSAFFVRRADFEAVGGFDPAIFLYHEDDDLALRLSARGKLMFIRDGLVTHRQGNATTRSPKVAALKAYHMGRSRVYALRKHGRPMAFLSSLWLAGRQVLSPLVLLSGRKRAKQVALLKGVLSSLRDGGAYRG